LSRLLRSAGAALPVVAAGAAFVIAWKIVVGVGGYKPFVLPSPETVFARFVGGWTDGTIGPHAAATLEEIAIGFGVATVLAFAVGYLLARSRPAARLLSPYIVAAQATPILALAPLIALWFGTGLLSKVIICALICFFPIAVSTMVGIQSVDRELLEMARAYRATPGQRLRLLEIPGALPSIFGGLRVGVTLAVVGAIVSEWAGADRGLGLLINLAKGSLFDAPLLFATLFTIAGIGVLLYLVVVLVERRVVGARG
jgi:NitT/TauT family transport system permease protein